MSESFTADEVKQSKAYSPAFDARLNTKENSTHTAMDAVLKKMVDANIIEYPQSFMDALLLIDTDTLDMVQDDWRAYLDPKSVELKSAIYQEANIPTVTNVGMGAYYDEYGIPVTVLTKEFRILALWYHEGKFFLLGNAAQIDPTSILLINERLDRIRWKAGISRLGVSETNVVDAVKARQARDAAEIAYIKQRNQLKNSTPMVKRRKAAKAAKDARRSNR